MSHQRTDWSPAFCLALNQNCSYAKHIHFTSYGVMSRNTRKNVMRRVRKWEKSVNEFVIHIQHTHMNKEFSHLIFEQTTKTIACGRVSEQARAQAMRSGARQPGKIMTIFPFIYYLINLSSIFSPSIRFCLLFRFLCFFCCASSIYKIFQLAWNMRICERILFFLYIIRMSDLPILYTYIIWRVCLALYTCFTLLCNPIFDI